MNRYDEINTELTEIRSKLAPITAEMGDLTDHGELTASQQDRWERIFAKGALLTERRDTLQAELRDLEAQAFATREAKTDEIRAGLESGRYSTEDGTACGPTLHRSTKVANPWAKPVEAYSSSEIREAAQTALARSANATKFATDLDPAACDRVLAAAERADGDEAAEWAIVASDPLYASAFTKFLQDPQGAHRSWSDGETKAYSAAHKFSQRASMAETSTHGSELIPTFLDPTIRLTNTGSQSDMRAFSQVYSTSTAVWNGVQSAGVNGEWVGELTEMADASPTFTSPSITAFKADVYVEASWELLGDTTVGAQLGLLFSDAKKRLEDTAWATGSGSGQPTGMITTLSTTTASKVSATTNGAFGALDVFATAQALPARYQDNAKWVFAPQIGIEMRKFALSSGNVSSAFWQDLGGGEPPKLLGYPTGHSTGMTSSLSASTASNDCILVIGDFRQGYVITDRVGSFLQTVPVVVGSSRRPIGATGFVYWWRTGGKLINPDAARVLIV